MKTRLTEAVRGFLAHHRVAALRGISDTMDDRWKELVEAAAAEEDAKNSAVELVAHVAKRGASLGDVQTADDRLRDVLCCAFEGGSDYWIRKIRYIKPDGWRNRTDLPTYLVL